ncbi:hypothetical protein U14_00432 [Candidatus Moduliflexus flocculans]|uniref:YkgJ family cysteine cluster protein n=1 Tax=Candidatus Moduliflexus flocculans TaxID=1499966 RepID=A0A0S6VWS9_9BACT|nr:hypothetical protein U14_00432 [Candidatus Moduliflexus flocculans]
MTRNNFLAKVKRTIGAFFPVSPARRGACNNCGACCHIMVGRCFWLKDGDDGKQYCRIYPIRPLNCRKYPRTESEWVTRETCGFYFEQPKNEPLPTPENS